LAGLEGEGRDAERLPEFHWDSEQPPLKKGGGDDTKNRCYPAGEKRVVSSRVEEIRKKGGRGKRIHSLRVNRF